MVKKIVLLFALILYFVLGKNAVFAQDKDVKDAYLNKLQNQIESNWLTPLDSKDKSAVVSFVINRDGSVSNVAIVRSSNNDEKILRTYKDDEFDKSVVDAVYKSAPFEPLTDSNYALSVQCFFSPIFIGVSNYNKGTELINPQSAFVNIANTTPVIDFSTYLTDLQNKINSNWNPRSLKKHRNATILVSVDKDGTVQDIKIQKSSNKKKFDNEITDSVMKSFPLNPLPLGLQSKYKNIQIDFIYEKTQDKNAPKTEVIAHVKNQDGYERYIEQIDTIMSEKLKDKNYFCKKDIVLEMNIDKNGKLTYIKLKNPSIKGKFIRKEFNRKTLLLLEQTSFPPIPNEMGLSDITLNYRILTQRKRLFSNLVRDYILNGFRTGLESYCIQDPSDI